MRLSAAGKIAWTKFKSRKLRTIVTSVITAIMLTILVGLSMAYSGVRSSIENIDGLNSDRSLAVVENIYSGFEEPTPEQGEDESSIIKTLDQAKQEYPEYDITGLYTNYRLFNTQELDVAIDGQKLNVNTEANPFNGNFRSISFNVRSKSLLEGNLFDGQSLEFKDDVIPVFLDTQSLEIIAGVDYSDQETKERIKNIGALVESYKGRVVELESSADEDVKLKLRFVGMSPVDSIFEGAFGLVKGVFIADEMVGDDTAALLDNFYNSSINFSNYFGPPPYDQPDESELSVVERGARYPQQIFEFANNEELARFKKDNSCKGFDVTEDCIVTSILGNAVLEFDEEIGSIWDFVKYVVLFFFIIAAIFLFFTTSKIIGDSRKETGVFRAMGAKRSDIAKIYALYTLIITTVAYLLSIVFATLVMLFINSKSADDLAEVATKATSSFGEAVEITFLGYSPKYLFYIWLVSIAVGLVGSAFPIIRNVMIDPIKAMRSE